MSKPVLDHGNVLSVHRAVTGYGGRRPSVGGRGVGTATWWYRDGRSAGSISHTTEIHTEDAGTLILEYRLNGEPVRQVFEMIGRPCRFGGRRWMALCPRTGRPVAKLYNCCGTFQPRHLLRGSYHSQGRVQPAEKLRDREVAILRRLGADDRSPPMPRKPKWMRVPTYHRLVYELIQVRNAHGLALAREFHQSTGIDLTQDDPEEEDPVLTRKVRRLATRYGASTWSRR